MKTFTTKSVEKLLLSLNNDPRLQSLDDTTILSEEQYPIAFDALIMRIKDPITLTTTVDTINYEDASAQAQSIPAAMRAQLKEKQNKLRNILQLNPTVDNPWDEVTAAHWMHRVTNICLDAAQMALMTVDTSPVWDTYLHPVLLLTTQYVEAINGMWKDSYCTTHCCLILHGNYRQITGI